MLPSTSQSRDMLRGGGGEGDDCTLDRRLLPLQGGVCWRRQSDNLARTKEGFVGASQPPERRNLGPIARSSCVVAPTVIVAQILRESHGASHTACRAPSCDANYDGESR